MDQTVTPRPVPAVVGLGLIGGSVALRLVAAGYRVVGYDVDGATRAQAVYRGIRTVERLADVAAAADLVVLAVPLTALDDVLAQLRGPLLANERLVFTDVTSVKAPVLDLARAHGLAERYVGGHPMAGTEHSGFAAADPGLLDGARWVLGLDGADKPGGLDRWRTVAAVVADLGARVVPATAAEHDAAVARISHLPHVFAELLAAAAGRGPAAGLASALAAGSFRDGTRVAATRPELVAAMWDGNAAALADVLDDVVADLDTLRRELRAGRSTVRMSEAGHRARLAWQRSGDVARRPWQRAWPRTGSRDAVADARSLVADLRELGRAGGWVDWVDGEGLSGVEPAPGPA